MAGLAAEVVLGGDAELGGLLQAAELDEVTRQGGRLIAAVDKAASELEVGFCPVKPVGYGQHIVSSKSG